MNQPPDMALLMIATLCGAGVVLAGAFYAFLFAFSRLRKSIGLTALAAVAYLLLVAATAGLSWSLDLSGWWQIVVAVMLLGYLVGPWAIWHLCRGTHANEHDDSPRGIGAATQEAMR